MLLVLLEEVWPNAQHPVVGLFLKLNREGEMGVRGIGATVN